MPHLDYGDVIWQLAAKIHLDQLQKLQNRAGRIILRVKPTEHKSTNQIHDILNWEYLQNRTIRHTCSMMYKILHNMAPEYLRDRFIYKSTRYSLRQSGKLSLPKPNTQNCKRTFLYRGSKLYNDIPIDIRTSSSLNIFNKSIKHTI